MANIPSLEKSSRESEINLQCNLPTLNIQHFCQHEQITKEKFSHK